MDAPDSITFVANTRLPSRRAQALQVAHMTGAFVRAGAPTRLLYAKRRLTVHLPSGTDVFTWYGVPEGKRPELVAVPCLDWIDRVPRLLQYVPARLQEQSFARNAVREIRRRFAGSRILAREVEVAAALVAAAEPRVYLEIHRVPGSRWRRRALLSAADGLRGIVAISRGVAEDLRALGIASANLCIEHDAYEPGRFAARPSKSEARAALELPRDVPLVVYTGGLLEWKGVDVLVEAARRLPEVYCVIAGGMEGDVQRLRQKAGGLPNVRIDGFQDPGRVALYLAAGDVGVVPNRSTPAISARYTSPLKVFESMATGLPLVVSDLPSLREILDAETAVFVAPDDPAALAQGLGSLLADPEGQAERSRRMRAAALEHTWDARADRLLRWMDQCEARPT